MWIQLWDLKSMNSAFCCIASSSVYYALSPFSVLSFSVTRHNPRKLGRYTKCITILCIKHVNPKFMDHYASNTCLEESRVRLNRRRPWSWIQINTNSKSPDHCNERHGRTHTQGCTACSAKWFLGSWSAFALVTHLMRLVYKRYCKIYKITKITLGSTCNQNGHNKNC